MVVRIYALVDIAAALVLLSGAVNAPAVLIYFCAFLLLLRGLMFFAFIPVDIPLPLKYSVDIVLTLFLLLSNITQPWKSIIIILLVFKALHMLAIDVLSKAEESEK